MSSGSCFSWQWATIFWTVVFYTSVSPRWGQRCLAGCPASLSGSSVTLAELISVLGFSHNLAGTCRKQQREASSFGLSWICGFWCIKTRILELNPEKHNSLQQPLSALVPSGLPPIRWQRSIEGLRSLLSLLFRVPAAPLQLNLNSWCVPEDKSPFNLSQVDAGPRVWCWYQAVGISQHTTNYSDPSCGPDRERAFNVCFEN